MSILLFCVILAIINACLCSECLKLDVSLTQKVEHEGFHRELRWLIETTVDTDAWNASGCWMALRQTVSSGMFVNPDEIMDSQLDFYIEGKVDVEAPAHEASEHVVYIYLNGSDIFKTYINLPFHLRYQRAQIGGKYGKVSLNKPSIITHCPLSLDQICQYKGLKVEAPCDKTAQSTCIWRNLSYHSLFDEVELFVPVGNLDDYPFVSIMTLLLGCAGCIYVLSLLATAPL